MAQDQTVAAAVVDALKEMGVRYVFGVPSGGWVDYMEALRKTDGIEFVLTTHEGPAGMMADVCGRLTGKPTSAVRSKVKQGALLVFTPAHIHSIQKEHQR